MVELKYYDIAFKDAIVDGIGFEKVFAIPDLPAINADSTSKKGSAAIYYGKGKNLMQHARNAIAIVPTDFEVSNLLLARLAEHNTILCMPISEILKSNGMQQQYLLHLASIAVKMAKRKKARLSVISFAESRLYVCSPIQLVAMASLLGIKEEDARLMLNKNSEIWEEYEGQA